ncbi:MAG: ribonuclease T [Pseudomonadota bacterium]
MTDQPGTPPAAPRLLCERFRGYLPVIVDVETGGFDHRKDALLEIAAVTLRMDEAGLLVPEPVMAFAVQPFPGANLEPSALAFTGIDPADPGRNAVPEAEVLLEMFQHVRRRVREEDCKRAILVGHNAVFDLNFLQAAVARCNNKRDPFHPFSCFDTVSLAGLACGQTVLAKACEAMGIPFDDAAAHNAAYDAERTAELFCAIVNKWRMLGGWPPG